MERVQQTILTVPNMIAWGWKPLNRCTSSSMTMIMATLIFPNQMMWEYFYIQTLIFLFDSLSLIFVNLKCFFSANFKFSKYLNCEWSACHLLKKRRKNSVFCSYASVDLFVYDVNLNSLRFIAIAPHSKRCFESTWTLTSTQHFREIFRSNKNMCFKIFITDAGFQSELKCRWIWFHSALSPSFFLSTRD